MFVGVAFNATKMADRPAAIIVDGHGAVREYRLGLHTAGTPLPTQVEVRSNRVAGDVRTVVLARAFKGATTAQFSFAAANAVLPFIDAVGSGPEYAFHKAMSSSTLVLAQVAVPNCLLGEEVTFGSTQGEIVYTHDDGTTETLRGGVGRCSNSTPSDLIPTRNARCDLTTYAGGLSCCHHKWLLTDREQRARIKDDDLLKFRMKVRIWWQHYRPATATTKASHQQLYRMYHSIAGEYDTTKQTPSHSRIDVDSNNVQTNVFKFKVQDLVRFGNTRTETFDVPFPTKNETGIKLLYLNGHCHAAACLQFDLYNDDTGELICRQLGRMGKTARPPASGPNEFDERGYVRLYPCLYGDPGSGLPAPPFLSFNTTLRSVKVTNATCASAHRPPGCRCGSAPHRRHALWRNGSLADEGDPE